jgi:transcription termination/antitermination protein NusA
MGIKYDNELIQYIALFEKLTFAQVHDCFFLKERLVFVVAEGELGKALGKNKVNLLKVEKLLNRKIKIVEFSPNLLQFIANFIYPIKVDDIKEEDGIVTIVGKDVQTKGLLIGAYAQNLRNLEKVVNNYFKIKEIKVV